MASSLETRFSVSENRMCDSPKPIPDRTPRPTRPYEWSLVLRFSFSKSVRSPCTGFSVVTVSVSGLYFHFTLNRGETAFKV